MNEVVRSEAAPTVAIGKFLEAFDHHVFSATMEFPQQHTRCEASLDQFSIGNIGVIRHYGRGLQQCVRRPEHIASDNVDDFVICIPQHSEYGVRLAGSECKTDSDGIVLLTTRQPFQVYIRNPVSINRFKVLYLRIPGPVLRHRVPNVDALCGRFIPNNPGTAHALQSIIEVALDDGPNMQPEDRNALKAALLDFTCVMAARALGNAEQGAERTSALERTYRRAKSFIEDNLSNDALCLVLVAGHCNVSPRYLNKAFAASSTSVASFIKDMRLQRCQEALRNKNHFHRSIFEIAVDWGFQSPQHFSRIYKAKFGCAPRSERALMP